MIPAIRRHAAGMTNTNTETTSRQSPVDRHVEDTINELDVIVFNGVEDQAESERLLHILRPLVEHEIREAVKLGIQTAGPVADDYPDVPEEHVEGVRQLLAQALVVSIATVNGDDDQLWPERRWHTEVRDDTDESDDITYLVSVRDVTDLPAGEG